MWDVIIAIDPGKRIGVAWVDRRGRLVRHEVVDAEALHAYPFPEGSRLVVGDGTGSAAIAAALRARGVSSELVDERGTSELARALYWRLYPPGCLGRLVPQGLRPPPRSLDDFAAYAIALRALEREAAGAAHDDAAGPPGPAA